MYGSSPVEHPADQIFKLFLLNSVVYDGARFTTRQLEILQLQQQGYVYKEISAILGISVKTVKSIMHNAHRRNKMSSDQLATKALRGGLLIGMVIEIVRKFGR